MSVVRTWFFVIAIGMWLALPCVADAHRLDEYLQARAGLPLTGAGRHTLRYRNTHRRATSVYLVNTLVPSNHAITIASQRRDPRQTELVLTYDVRAP
jgi:hypothetical protein